MKTCKICGVSETELKINENGICEFCKAAIKSLEVHTRKSCSCELQKFDVYSDEYDWLEVTEWTNGEGIDIHMYIKRGEPKEQTYHFTRGQLEAIMACCSKIGIDIPNYSLS